MYQSFQEIWDLRPIDNIFFGHKNVQVKTGFRWIRNKLASWTRIQIRESWIRIPGSVSQRCTSEDPDPHSDASINVTDP